MLRRRVPAQSLRPMCVTHLGRRSTFSRMLSLCLTHLCVCAANPYPDVRRRYWNAYMLFYQKISDQNSPVLPKKSRVSIMRQEAEDLTL